MRLFHKAARFELVGNLLFRLGDGHFHDVDLADQGERDVARFAHARLHAQIRVAVDGNLQHVARAEHDFSGMGTDQREGQQ